MGATIESMSHDFDIMRYLVGDATSAMGKVATSRPDLNGYDNITSCILTLANGAMATINSSWAGHEPLFQIGILGSDASLIMENEIIRWKRAHGPEIVLEANTPEDRIPGLEREVRYFIQCLKTGEKPLPDVADGLATLKISHAVIKSSNEGIVVPIQ
jgi:myo-inositol 2-dehydrogenase/D-chiro-inositol 1-dehydrogenase